MVVPVNEHSLHSSFIGFTEFSFKSAEINPIECTSMNWKIDKYGLKWLLSLENFPKQNKISKYKEITHEFTLHNNQLFRE